MPGYETHEGKLIRINYTKRQIIEKIIETSIEGSYLCTLRNIDVPDMLIDRLFHDSNKYITLDGKIYFVEDECFHDGRHPNNISDIFELRNYGEVKIYTLRYCSGEYSFKEAVKNAFRRTKNEM